MYKIHITEGIVLETRQQAEVDAFYYIYTKEYGLLGMVATGVKLQKSKLKFSLQPFSLVEIGFVKGKSSIKITHASLKSRLSNISDKRFFARLSERLLRLVKGEEKNDELYSELINFFKFIRDTDNKSVEIKLGLEIVFTIKLLYTLGYWMKEGDHDIIFQDGLSLDVAEYAYKNKDNYVSKIQNALAQTQL